MSSQSRQLSQFNPFSLLHQPKIISLSCPLSKHKLLNRLYLSNQSNLSCQLNLSFLPIQSHYLNSLALPKRPYLSSHLQLLRKCLYLLKLKLLYSLLNKKFMKKSSSKFSKTNKNRPTTTWIKRRCTCTDSSWTSTGTETLSTATTSTR